MFVRRRNAKEIFKNPKKTNLEAIYIYKDGLDIFPKPQAEVDIRNGELINNLYDMIRLDVLL